MIAVEAAPERCPRSTTSDPLLLARAAYHLGNRHVPVQVDSGRLRYQHDHVLDEMVRASGSTLTEVEAPFEPEAAPTRGHGDAHPHSRVHSHGHDHD